MGRLNKYEQSVWGDRQTGLYGVSIKQVRHSPRPAVVFPCSGGQFRTIAEAMAQPIPIMTLMKMQRNYIMKSGDQVDERGGESNDR